MTNKSKKKTSSTTTATTKRKALVSGTSTTTGKVVTVDLSVNTKTGDVINLEELIIECTRCARQVRIRDTQHEICLICLRKQMYIPTTKAELTYDYNDK